MRSPMADPSRVLLAALALAAVSAAACVIGPKQDDPASGAPSFTMDTGTGADSGLENDDAVPTTTPDSELPGDASADAPSPKDSSVFDAAGDASDATSDAPSDDTADSASDASDASDALEGG